jgi:hypothetical protein
MDQITRIERPLKELSNFESSLEEIKLLFEMAEEEEDS